MASVASTSSTALSFHSLTSSFAAPSRGNVSFRRTVPPARATTYATVNVSLAPAKTSSFYDILGIEAGATRQEIKAAYRRLALTVHPDATLANKSPADHGTSAEVFIRVHEAYSTLSDPHKRADYDKMLLTKRCRLRHSPSYAVSMGRNGTSSYNGFSGYTRRTWETDQCW